MVEWASMGFAPFPYQGRTEAVERLALYDGSESCVSAWLQTFLMLIADSHCSMSMFTCPDIHCCMPVHSMNL